MTALDTSSRERATVRALPVNRRSPCGLEAGESRRHRRAAGEGFAVSAPEQSLASVAREGREARYRGDPESANPHPDGSEAHAVWRRAWEIPDGESAEREAPEREPSHPRSSS